MKLPNRIFLFLLPMNYSWQQTKKDCGCNSNSKYSMFIAYKHFCPIYGQSFQKLLQVSFILNIRDQQNRWKKTSLVWRRRRSTGLSQQKTRFFILENEANGTETRSRSKLPSFLLENKANDQRIRIVWYASNYHNEPWMCLALLTCHTHVPQRSFIIFLQVYERVTWYFGSL